MAKEVSTDFQKTLKGLNLAADIVTSTLGPGGRNVYFEVVGLGYEITNDGVTVGNQIILKDKIEDAGAYVIRNITGQALDSVGDGTTTTALLTQQIIKECLKRPENPMKVRESLKKATEKTLSKLSKLSRKITKDDILKVALISAEDKKIASLITEIIQNLGNEAIINVEDSRTFTTDYEIVKGYEAHVGFMSPHFITDKKSSKAIYENVPVMICEKKIAALSDLTPIFDMFKSEGITSCVIVCEEIDDSLLGAIINTKLAGIFNALVIRATGWLLQDIEGATGATMISSSRGTNFQNFSKDYLGYATKVVCDSNKTLFITDGTAAKKYANILESQGENDPNMFSSRKTLERVAKLRGGIAVLRIAASTDNERTYLRRKAEDAVKATLAALEEGIVEGGGLTLWKLAQGIEGKTIGEEVLKEALTSPFRKIVENCGKDYTEVVLNMPKDKGYDAKEDKYVDMFKSGIVDPAKVTRMALTNASSSAGIFITASSVITEANETK
jgi:chaperonin GroEL